MAKISSLLSDLFLKRVEIKKTMLKAVVKKAAIKGTVMNKRAEKTEAESMQVLLLVT